MLVQNHCFFDLGIHGTAMNANASKCTQTINFAQFDQSEYLVMATGRLTSWRSSIGIDAALDLCHALLMADDHRGDRDCAAYEDGADRDQQTTQARD